MYRSFCLDSGTAAALQSHFQVVVVVAVVVDKTSLPTWLSLCEKPPRPQQQKVKQMKAKQ